MLGHSNIKTTQIYAKVTSRKIGNEMNMFAGNVKQWDAKLQPASKQEEITVEETLKSLQISTGKASDVIWENLTAKVWNKMPNVERQAFASDVNSRAIKPKTLRDFYMNLMDYFLDSQ